jgi:hypothetical protein
LSKRVYRDHPHLHRTGHQDNRTVESKKERSMSWRSHCQCLFIIEIDMVLSFRDVTGDALQPGRIQPALTVA